jgi:hypothetical protein
MNEKSRSEIRAVQAKRAEYRAEKQGGLREWVWGNGMGEGERERGGGE